MKRRILLADDSVTIQKVIELTFMDEDYEVRAVSNGDEAISALPELDPDFVIADVHMPGANGYEVCRRAKAMRPDLPVLLLVGTFEPFDEGQSRAAGADSFLKKPFDSQELLQRVDDLLARTASSRVSELPLSAAEPLPQTPQTPQTSTGTDWSAGFELEAEPEPEPAALSMPSFEPFEDRPSTPPYPSAGQSPFLEEESPFSLEEDRSATAYAAPAPTPDTALPAGEPMFDLDAPQLSPLEEPVSSAVASPSGFPTTPEERLGIPQGAAPLVGSLAETEARIEAPAPASVAASHEPESIWPTPAPPAAAAPLPVGSATPAAGNGSGRLSDEDVDRVARRVVELMGDKAVREIAWEVIPDLAEVVIRERLRELESQVEDL